MPLESPATGGSKVIGVSQHDGIPIGELARRTGTAIKTIRYYSDIGLLPEAGRTSSGYRRYDATAATRLAFIRTLRELGVGLAAIRDVLGQQASVAEVAAAHAEALDSQIRILRMHRSVLRALAHRKPTLQEVDLMNRIAKASADERHRILTDFLDHVFDGLDVNPRFEQMMRSVKPDLPDDPTPEQVDAWVELAELLADPDFRDRIRGMAQRQAADPAPSGTEPESWQRLAALVADRGGAALDAGVDPESAAADPVLDEIVGAFADQSGEADDAAFRGRLLDQVRSGTDERAERYWQLLAVINGWPPVPSTTPAWRWVEAALHARAG